MLVFYVAVFSYYDDTGMEYEVMVVNEQESSILAERKAKESRLGKYLLGIGYTLDGVTRYEVADSISVFSI